MKTLLAALLLAAGFLCPCVHAQQSDTIQYYLSKGAKGSVAHQFNLGIFYDDGKGVAQNYAEAVKWYRMAAAQGDASSQKELGNHYYRGQGVEQSYAEAVKWYRKCAKGDANAQRLLGDRPAGKGVAENYAEAVKWYQYYNPPLPQYRIAQPAPAARTPAPSAPSTPQPALQTAKLPPIDIPPSLSTGVDMVRENGVLKVPVQINGAITLKFVVDSGASDVQIPKDVFLTLVRTETITEKDFLPGKTFVLADGSKVKSDRFILRSIKVGESTFANVEASIGGLDASLLLGQSFLSRLDEWKIDNKKSQLILTK